TVSRSGDSDLQRTSTYHGRIIEIAKRSVANDVAQNTALHGLFRHHSVQGFLRRGDDHKKYSIEVARFKAPLFPNNLVLTRPALNFPGGGRSHHDHARSASQERRDFFFRRFPGAHHETSAPGKFDEHRKERTFISRESRRRYAHIPPQAQTSAYRL